MRSKMAKVLRILLGSLIGLLCASLQAERADRMKPMMVEADQFVRDETRRVSKFQGKVVLNKGSLQIRADEIEIVEDQAGHQSATAVGNPVQFRQKREAVNEMIEGQGRRLFYASREETVRLEEAAEMRRLVEGKPADIMQGELIVYDSRKERYEVNIAGARTEAKPQIDKAAGRVRVVIQPRPDNKP